MLDKIFVRRYADPLDPPALDTFLKRTGLNSGNLLFASAAQRNLTVDGVDVTSDSLTRMVHGVDRLNDEGRHVVIPLANAFRTGFLDQLRKVTEAVERLTVPVTVLGVGAQFALDGSGSTSPEVDLAAQRFLRAVLDKGPSVGVRGERTAAYLANLGFGDVEVIGCPSMFMHGRSLTIRDDAPAFDRSTRLGLNLTPRVRIPEGWVEDLLRRHPDTRFIAQDVREFEAMAGGRPVKAKSAGYPSSSDHPLITRHGGQFHQHATTWIETLSRRDFVLGHRIHGNIAALLAGTPAHVIIHDSRTRELCEYFEIPHTPVTEHTADLTPQRLHDASDYTRLVKGHGERADRMAAFLERHGLRHCLDLPPGEAPYDRAVERFAGRTDLTVRVEATEPPQAEGGLLSRLRRRRHGHR